MTRYTFFLIGLLCFSQLNAQEAETAMAPAPIQELFRSYRLVTGHTTETLYKGDLLVCFSHRFTGPLNGGLETFFGLDQYSDVRFAFAYGLTDRITLEVGRSRLNRTYDGQIKYAITRQWDQNKWPLAISALGQISARTVEWRTDQEQLLKDKHRFRYVGQIFIAHQFPFGLNLQLTPTWVHKNLAESLGEKNDTWLLGAGIRQKITEKYFLSFEIFQPLSNRDRDVRTIKPVGGLSFDIISPRHAFQLQITNASALPDADFMTSTFKSLTSVNSWLLGFHITRTF